MGVQFRPRAGDIGHWHLLYDGLWTGWRLSTRDGALLNDKNDVIGLGMSKGEASSILTKAVLEGHVTPLVRSPDEEARIEDYRRVSGYRAPPMTLWPTRGPDLDPAAWDVLLDWLAAHTENPRAALLVYVTDRTQCTIGEAYVITDGFMKRRNDRLAQMKDPDWIPGHN